MKFLDKDCCNLPYIILKHTSAVNKAYRCGIHYNSFVTEEWRSALLMWSFYTLKNLEECYALISSAVSKSSAGCCFMVPLPLFREQFSAWWSDLLFQSWNTQLSAFCCKMNRKLECSLYKITSPGSVQSRSMHVWLTIQLQLLMTHQGSKRSWSQ